MCSPPDSVGESSVFLGCPVGTFIRSSGQILLPWYLTNGLNNVDNTDMEYSLAPTD